MLGAQGIISAKARSIVPLVIPGLTYMIEFDGEVGQAGNTLEPYYNPTGATISFPGTIQAEGGLGVPDGWVGMSSVDLPARPPGYVRRIEVLAKMKAAWKDASKDQGWHLITENSVANGSILTYFNHYSTTNASVTIASSSKGGDAGTFSKPVAGDALGTISNYIGDLHLNAMIVASTYATKRSTLGSACNAQITAMPGVPGFNLLGKPGNGDNTVLFYSLAIWDTPEVVWDGT